MGSTQREMPVIPSAEASSSTCVPVPENSCSGRAAAENSRSAPDGAERPTSSPACARDARDRAEAAPPPPVQEWRTGKRQPWVHHNAERKSLPYTLQIRCAPHKSARSDQFKTVTSTEMGPGKGAWATEAAAKLAKAEFKAWVNTEMNKPKRAGAAASAASRAAAAASAASRAAAPADAEPQLPVRFSERTGAKVEGRFDPAAAEMSWRERSADFRGDASKRRVEGFESHVAATKAQVSAERFRCFMDRCRAASSEAARSAARSMRRRGKERCNLVGERSGRDAGKRRKRLAQQLEREHKRHREDSVTRVGAIERLMKAIRTCDVTSLLKRAPTGDDAPAAETISAKQAVRLSMQSLAVVEMLSEENRLEEAVLDGCARTPLPPPARPLRPLWPALGRSERRPTGGIMWRAATVAAEKLGKYSTTLTASTVRAWRCDYMASADEEAERGFTPDRRGKWARELLIHEEDIQKKFRKWMIQRTKAEDLSVEAAHKYLNTVLLVPPLVSAELLEDYHMTLPISLDTAWRWMRAVGAVASKFKQSFYNDSHESALVKRDRQVRSRRDLGAISARSRRDRGAIYPTISAIYHTISARSRRDLGAISARSRRDHGAIST